MREEIKDKVGEEFSFLFVPLWIELSSFEALSLSMLSLELLTRLSDGKHIFVPPRRLFQMLEFKKKKR